MQSIYSGSARGGLEAEGLAAQRRSMARTLYQDKMLQVAAAEEKRRYEQERLDRGQAAQNSLLAQQQRAQEYDRARRDRSQREMDLARQAAERNAEATKYQRGLEAVRQDQQGARLTLAQQAEARQAAAQKWKQENPKPAKPTSLEIISATETAPGLQTEIPAVDSGGQPIPGKKGVSIVTDMQRRALMEAGKAGMSLQEAAKASGIGMDDVPGLAGREYQDAIDERGGMFRTPWGIRDDQAELETKRQEFKAKMRQAREQDPRDMYFDGSKWAKRTTPKMSLDSAAPGAPSPSMDSGPASGGPQVKTDFGSMEEAEAAGLPVGTVIKIGGRRAIVR